MTEKTFTLAQLAQYDGQNGQPAYVAVDGVVYDVTNSRMGATMAIKPAKT